MREYQSPLGWEHIVLTGDYDWNSGAAQGRRHGDIERCQGASQAFTWFPRSETCG